MPIRSDIKAQCAMDAFSNLSCQLQNSLKPGGRLAIIDFTMESPVGPPKSGRIAPEQVKAELQRAGYVLAEEHGFLPNQYFLIFRPDKS